MKLWKTDALAAIDAIRAANEAADETPPDLPIGEPVLVNDEPLGRLPTDATAAQVIAAINILAQKVEALNEAHNTNVSAIRNKLNTTIAIASSRFRTFKALAAATADRILDEIDVVRERLKRRKV